jgi:NADH-quinone oxidoreductase subunit C
VTAPIFELLLQQLVPVDAEAASTTEASDENTPPVRSLGVQHGVLVLAIVPSALLPIAQRLRDEFTFDLFLDVTAVDWPGEALRFEVVHHFYSTTHKARVRLKIRVPESDPTVDSLTPLFGSAGYMERECHDMYGIVFRGNPDLRPILLYEGFVGHPLRKDYPKQKEQPLVPYRPPQGALVR